jgi:hypothetical protein
MKKEATAGLPLFLVEKALGKLNHSLVLVIL